MKHTVMLERTPPAETAAFPQGVTTAFENLFGLHAVEMTEIVFINHAEPDYQARPMNGVPGDPPLSEKGRNQAMRLAMRLRSASIDAVYTSTARAAVETALLIAASQDLPMTREPQLREIAFNDESTNGHGPDVQKTATDALMRFLNKPRWDSLRGFEPSRQFRHRAVQAVEGIMAHNPGKRIVVVTHRGVINAYLSMVLDIGRDMFFLPEYASISVLRFHGDLHAVQNLNDVAHLAPTSSPS